MHAAVLPCFAPVTPGKYRTTHDYQCHEATQVSDQVLIGEERACDYVDIDMCTTEHEPVSEKVSSQESEIQKGDRGENQGVEPNKIQSKRPKRKRHRPKVIREGKPFRTLKPLTPMPKVPRRNMNEASVGKRRYVKKKTKEKSIVESMESNLHVAGGIAEPDVRTETILVRRKLDFDVEEQVGHQSAASTQEGYAVAKQSVQVLQRARVLVRSQQEGPEHCFHSQKPNRVLKKSVRSNKDAYPPSEYCRKLGMMGSLKGHPKEGDGVDGSSDEPFRDRVSVGEKKACEDDSQFLVMNGAPRDIQFAEASMETDQVTECKETGAHDPFCSISYKRRRTEDGQKHSTQALFLLTKTTTMKTIGTWKTMKSNLSSGQTRGMTQKNLNVPTRARSINSTNKKRGFRKLHSAPKEPFRSEDGQESKSYGLGIITYASPAEKNNSSNFHTCFTPDSQMSEDFHNLDHANSLSQALVPVSVMNDMGAYKSQSALVPYEGHGMLLPYKNPSDEFRKEDGRPKVILDEISILIWKHLEKNGVESTLMCGLLRDERFEEDMRLTHSRVDLFISAMCPILGDRRFSQWKGSVLDSVVGVFLTQNVSDNLSSSAYMKLASTFPLQSSSRNSEFFAEKMSISMEQIDGCLSASDTTNVLQEMMPDVENKDVGPEILHETEQMKEKQMLKGSEIFGNNSGVGMTVAKHESIQVPGEDTEIAFRTQDVGTVNSQGASQSQDEHTTNLQKEERQTKSQAGNNNDKTESRRDGFLTSKRFQTKVENNASRTGVKLTAETQNSFDWDSLRREYSSDHRKERSVERMDSVDWESVRNADVKKIAKAIVERGMQNQLADKIKDFLNRVVRDHGRLDLEWLRDIPPDKAKAYLLSIRGLGLKSVDCVRLLALNQIAFPVDVNVCRIAVRLGWVPLQPLPDHLQIHRLEEYPLLDSVQTYLWPRLCTLDWERLYELHYHMITFGKVFCTKIKPNCKACPLKTNCRHFASQCASTRRALPSPEVVSSTGVPSESIKNPFLYQFKQLLSLKENKTGSCEPIIEEPRSPTLDDECIEDIEDIGRVTLDDYDSDDVLTINLNSELNQNVCDYIQAYPNSLQDDGALVALDAMPKSRTDSHLRTKLQVYVLPDFHPIVLQMMDKRDVDDPCPYLLAIIAPGKTAESTGLPKTSCNNEFSSKLNDNLEGFACKDKREGKAATVKGTVLIPCRTAMRGRFPLNGTYFQTNEVFADHETSQKPIDVPREWLQHLLIRTVYFGSSISPILKGLETEEIRDCFSEGYICIRGFCQETREPKELSERFHLTANKVQKKEGKASKEEH